MKIYDGGKIIAGAVVFLIIVTYPFWSNWGKTTKPPELSLATPTIEALKEKGCIEETSFMRVNHMKLLDEWKEQAVRDGDRLYRAKDGKLHSISLTGNCLGCHSNKGKFCDRCHDYVGAKPTCYRCHIIPAEGK